MFDAEPARHLLQVGRELVEEVVDDVGCEHVDAQLVGQLLRLPVDRHVKGQDAGKLLAPLLQHDGGTHDIPFVHLQGSTCLLTSLGAQPAEQHLPA